MNMQLQSQESSSQGQSESITLDKCNSTTDQNIFCKTISPKGIAIPAITIKLRPPEEKKRKEKNWGKLASNHRLSIGFNVEMKWQKEYETKTYRRNRHVVL